MARKKDKRVVEKRHAGKTSRFNVLAISATPVHTDDVEREKEEELILDSLMSLDFEPGWCNLEMPDGVQSTMTEIHDYLKSREPHVLFLLAHGYKNCSGNIMLAFEEDDGSLNEVTPKKLAQIILSSDHVPGVVILWNHPVKHRELLLADVAKKLQNAGIPRVIGFRKALSPEAAREFTTALFCALKKKQNVRDAFEAAKHAISTGEQKRLKKDPNWRPVEEEQSPQYYSTGELYVIADHLDTSREITRPLTRWMAGPDYTNRGFIGRGPIIRSIFQHIDNGETAVVIHGNGGVGKSALLTRVVALLKPGKYLPILFQGSLSAETILETIARAATDKGIKDVSSIFTSPIPYKEKLEKLLETFVYKFKLLLLFDDFDLNQDTEGKFLNERVKELLLYLKDELKNKGPLMLFATRYPLPKFTSVELQPLTWLDFRKLVARTFALCRLSGKDLKCFYFEMGGYPRAVQWFDTIARHGYGPGPVKWEDLRERVPGLTERILHKESETADLSYLLIDRLLELLDNRQRDILHALSLYRGEVPMAALAAHGVDVSLKERKSMEQAGLLEYFKTRRLFQVPRLLAQAVLSRIPEDQLKKIHLVAASFLRNSQGEKAEITLTVKTEKGEETIQVLPFDQNDIEARYHYLEAGDVVTALELTKGMDGYYSRIGYPQLGFDLLNDLEKHVAALTIDNQLWLRQRLGMFYSLFGKLDEALKQYESALGIFQSLGNTRSSAWCHGQIAMLYEARAKYEEAVPHFEKSLEIHEQLGDQQVVAQRLDQLGMIYKRDGKYAEAGEKYRRAEKINRELGNKKSLASNLEQLGRIDDEQGKFDEGLDYYRQSLALREELGDKPGIATLVHQMGNVSFFRGNLDEAFGLYERSLEINKEINNSKGAGYSQGQIGLIWQRRGHIDEALKHFQESLAFFEKADEKKGIAASHHQIGRILESKEDRENALTHYEKALEIRENSGDLLGAAITYGQLGMLFFFKEEFETALRYSAQAYAIFTRFGSPNADLARNNMLRLRQKLSQETFDAILTQYNIKTEPGNKKESAPSPEVNDSQE